MKIVYIISKYLVKYTPFVWFVSLSYPASFIRSAEPSNYGKNGKWDVHRGYKFYEKNN